MTLRIVQATDRTQWDTTLAQLATAHVLQTWDWGDFKGRWGWKPMRLLFERDGQAVAAAQMLHRRLPRTPLSVIYVPKGPAMDYGDTDLLAYVLTDLEKEARRQKSLFVKIDPDVWLGTGSDNLPPLQSAAAVLEILKKRGWQLSSEQIQFRNTVMIDLSPDENDLLAHMKAKTRYNVRLASRKGVQVRPGNKDDLRIFYSLYYETATRDGFLIRPITYYLDVWAQFLQANRAHLLLAEVEGVTIAGLMLFHFGQTAWYMYGASSNQYRQLMPNYVLQWEAMRLAKRLGCLQYDLWGAPDRFDASDSMWGVYRFKTGLGGETTRGMGAFDFAPSPWLYWAYTVAMPRVLASMRRRHQLER